MAGEDGFPGVATSAPSCADASASSDASATAAARAYSARRGLQAFQEARRRLQMQTTETRQLLSFALVCCTVGVDFTGVTMQIPLMPFYVEEFDDAKEMGFGAANAVLMTSYTASQFLATPLFGMASDRFGRRPMLLISLMGGSLGFFMQAFANSLWSLAALRFFTGLFAGSRPVALAYVGDAAPLEKQPKYVAGISGVISISLFVAPVFGGSMGLVSLRLPCLFQAALGLLVLFGAYRYLEEPGQASSSPRRQAQGGARVAPLQPSRGWKLPLVANALVGCLAMGIIASWQTLLPVIGSRDVGLNQNELGLIMGMAGLAIAAMQFGIFLPLSRRVRLPLIGCVGLVLLSAPSLLLLTGTGMWQLVWLTFVHAAGAGLVMGGLSIVVNMLSPPGLRGTAMALTVTAQAGSRVLFPIVSGPMYDACEWAPLALIASAGVAAAAIELALAPCVRRLPRPAGRAPEPAGEQRADAKGRGDEGVLGRPLDSWEPEGPEEETQLVLESLRNIRDELEGNLQLWRGKLRGLHEGMTPEELSILTDLEGIPAIEDDQKAELGGWLSDLLVQRNYKRWPQHLDSLKRTLKIAFPQVQMAPASTRAEDMIYLLEGQLLLEKRSERFVVDRRQAWHECNESYLALQ